MDYLLIDRVKAVLTRARLHFDDYHWDKTMKIIESISGLNSKISTILQSNYQSRNERDKAYTETAYIKWYDCTCLLTEIINALNIYSRLQLTKDQVLALYDPFDPASTRAADTYSFDTVNKRIKDCSDLILVGSWRLASCSPPKKQYNSRQVSTLPVITTKDTTKQQQEAPQQEKAQKQSRLTILNKPVKLTEEYDVSAIHRMLIGDVEEQNTTAPEQAEALVAPVAAEAPVIAPGAQVPGGRAPGGGAPGKGAHASRRRRSPGMRYSLPDTPAKIGFKVKVLNNENGEGFSNDQTFLPIEKDPESERNDTLDRTSPESGKGASPQSNYNAV